MPYAGCLSSDPKTLVPFLGFDPDLPALIRTQEPAQKGLRVPGQVLGRRLVAEHLLVFAVDTVPGAAVPVDDLEPLRTRELLLEHLGIVARLLRVIRREHVA